MQHNQHLPHLVHVVYLDRPANNLTKLKPPSFLVLLHRLKPLTNQRMEEVGLFEEPTFLPLHSYTSSPMTSSWKCHIIKFEALAESPTYTTTAESPTYTTTAESPTYTTTAEFPTYTTTAKSPTYTTTAESPTYTTTAESPIYTTTAEFPTYTTTAESPTYTTTAESPTYTTTAESPTYTTTVKSPTYTTTAESPAYTTTAESPTYTTTLVASAYLKRRCVNPHIICRPMYLTGNTEWKYGCTLTRKVQGKLRHGWNRALASFTVCCLITPVRRWPGL